MEGYTVFNFSTTRDASIITASLERFSNLSHVLMPEGKDIVMVQVLDGLREDLLHMVKRVVFLSMFQGKNVRRCQFLRPKMFLPGKRSSQIRALHPVSSLYWISLLLVGLSAKQLWRKTFCSTHYFSTNLLWGKNCSILCQKYDWYGPEKNTNKAREPNFLDLTFGFQAIMFATIFRTQLASQWAREGEVKEAGFWVCCRGKD